MYCIMQERTCCLYKCVDSIVGNINFKSKYQRLIRFLQMEHVDTFCLSVCYVIINLLQSHGMISQTLVIALDRTNWKIDQININLLFLGFVLPNQVFIPILWVPLEKRGNSNQDERIDLLSKFLSLWQVQTTEQLLADREFVGSKWIVWLKDKGFSFVIRSRQNMYLKKMAQVLKWSITDSKAIKKRAIKEVRKYGFLKAGDRRYKNLLCNG